MKKYILYLFLIFSTYNTLAQEDAINQYDASGKKHGKWMLYLNELGDKIYNSTKAYYWRYTYYDHGLHIYPMMGFIRKNGKLVSTNNDKVEIGKPIRLDGEYKCFDKKGVLKFIHVFENGNYISYKEFYKTGEVKTHFDYKKHCFTQPQSWWVYVYTKEGKLTHESCTAKDKNGNWPSMRD